MPDGDAFDQDRRTIASSVAERANPGWKAVKAVPLSSTPAGSMISGMRDGGQGPGSDVVMPSIATLRAKYLSAQDNVSSSMGQGADASQAADQDTLLVQMEAGPLRRVVAVSASEEKALWSQG